MIHNSALTVLQWHHQVEVSQYGALIHTLKIHLSK